jgi:hypothetical protein
MNWKDIAERAIKTFVQTLTAAVTVTALLGGDMDAIKAGAYAAVAASLSVIWNAVQQWSQSD